MHFYVYILHSTTAGKYYIGQTGNLEDRLFRHNNSGSNYIKSAHDWQLVYTESFPTRNEACKKRIGDQEQKEQKIY